MTAEEIKKEIERMQDVTKDIKVSVGNLRSDISKLEGAIKQDNDEFEARLAEAESRGFRKGYEKGFAEGCKWGADNDEIRVGDEVIDHTQSEAYTGFVIEVQSADVLKMMSLKDGIWSVRRSNVDKTGRHFDEVEKLLEAMKK